MISRRLVSVKVVILLVLWVTIGPVSSEEYPNGVRSTSNISTFEREGKWREALSWYLKRIDESTTRAEADAYRHQAEDLIENLREDPAKLLAGSVESIESIESVLAEAVRHHVMAAAMLLGEKLRSKGRSKDAFDWYRQAATRGYPPAMIQVGLMYSNGDGVDRNMEKASSWLRPANVKGSAVGKYLLAECFLYGKGVEANQALAVTLLMEAVELDRPERALDLLATCYHKGWGVEQDSKQAAFLYEQACDGAFHNACGNLAVLYMTGDGVELNPNRAVSLLKHGISHENPMCMFFYAATLLDGLGGLKRDSGAACDWFRRAAEGGNKAAISWCRTNNVAVEVH